MSDFPRKAYVDFAITADVLLSEKVPDEVRGRLIRESAQRAMDEIRKLTPNPVLGALEARLTAYDHDEWEAYAKAEGLRPEEPKT